VTSRILTCLECGQNSVFLYFSYEIELIHMKFLAHLECGKNALYCHSINIAEKGVVCTNTE